MRTTRPREALRRGKKAFTVAKAPRTFTSKASRKAERGTSSKGPATAMPAFTTRPQRPSPTRRSLARRRSSSRVTSRRRGTTPSWAKRAASSSRRTPP